MHRVHFSHLTLSKARQYDTPVLKIKARPCIYVNDWLTGIAITAAKHDPNDEHKSARATMLWAFKGMWALLSHSGQFFAQREIQDTHGKSVKLLYFSSPECRRMLCQVGGGRWAAMS